MTDAARSSSRMGGLPLGPLGARRRSSDRESTGGGATARPRGRLFRKYVLLIVGLVSLVLLLNSALDFWFSYDENKAALFRIQQEKAGSAARRIEQFLDEIERQLGWTTAPQWAASPLEQRRFDYVRLLRQAPAITELIQLDDTGKEQLKVSRLAMDVVGSEKDYSQSPGFIEARQHRVWFSPVYFRKESEPYMTVALARTGRNAGVTVAEANLKLIWDVITGLKIGQGGYAYVVDRDGRLIAHPDISLVLRNTDLSHLPQVAAALAGAPSLPSPAGGGGLGWGQPIDRAVMVAKGISGNSVLTAHASIAPLGWTVFVELPLNEALAPLFGSMLRTAALLALALVLATLAALLLARRMTVPIRELQAGAARIGAGELDRYIAIRTGDELEDLAGDFNRMAADLQKSYADLEKKVEDRTAELKEALDQQTATAEVLGVINSSPGDLTPVFDAMLQNALRLCEADFGVLLVREGNLFRTAALRGVPAALAEFLSGTPREPGKHAAVGRMLDGEDFVHFEDMTAERAYQSGDRRQRAFVELGGTRSYVAVALRKDGQLLGSLAAYRREVRPFTDKQIALLQNFAAQAVIAMENARLITETREALEQQTATAEVLQVINSSPGDLVPVFQSIVEKAHTLCGAACGSLQLWDGEKFRGVAMRGFSEAMVELLRLGYSPSDMPCQRIVEGERVVHCADLAGIDSPVAREGGVKLGGVRTILYVALRKDDVLLGQIVAARQEVRPFSEKEIALVESFAAQAVIAMENARLLTETREALEQQTATAEVLQVINSSPGDLAPVFDAMLEKATGLCEAAYGHLWTYDGERFHPVAMHGEPRFAEWLLKRGPMTPAPKAPHGRIVQGERFVHIVDALNDEAYESQGFRDSTEISGTRTQLVVPLHRDDTLLGVIHIYRKEVRPFSDKQIALLQNFAAQAVIAMENARLITETREALEQQTATAEVLQVINGSPGDLAPVFDAMLEKAMRLCRIALGALELQENGKFRAVAVRGVSGPLAELLRQPFEPPPGSPLARLLAGERVVQITDMSELARLRPNDPRAQAGAQYGLHTALFVPLRKDADLLGQVVAFRQEVRPFSDKEIALLENFAAQAVIAMENARLLAETRDALEQQTATAEVLQVINSSPGDLHPVFDAMLEKAMALSGASFGGLSTYDGDQFLAVAMHGVPAALEEFFRNPYTVSPQSYFGQLVGGKTLLHVADLAAERPPGAAPLSRAGVERGRAFVDLGKARTGLFLALRKEDALLGILWFYRQEVRPFSEKQIALLQNFAEQAVIAMENARLLTETREALDQQTATAEVLQVINSSPGDLTPVFQAILEKAHALCGAAFGGLMTWDGEYLRAVATHNVPLAFAEVVGGPFRPGPKNRLGALIRGEPLVHLADLREVAAGAPEDRVVRTAVELGGIRTLLAVPLRKDGTLLGIITAYRQEVRPFLDEQIALLQNFAAQAVIAMENARLLTETREALEQQTATAEVLQVINSSPGDLPPVFDAMLEKAIRLCEAAFGSLWTYDGQCFHAVAVRNVPAALAEFVRQPHAAGPNTPLGRVVRTKELVSIADLATDEMYRSGDRWTAAPVELGGARSYLAIPLLKDDALIGAFAVSRREVRPFSEKEIALLENFAAQAVIAMENARLITELRQRTRDLQESLEYQTATSDVLKVISRSGAELQPVLDNLVETAARICEAEKAFIFRLQDGLYRMVTSFGFSPEYKDFILRHPIAPGRGTLVGRTALELLPVHIEDAANDPEYTWTESQRLGQFRTMLGVPLLREDAPIGVLALVRSQAEPFTEKQIALVTTFADQAVIAIENARLFNELRARTEELGSSVAELKMLSEVGQAVSSTLDLRTVLSTILNASLGVTWANAGAVFRYARAERAFRLVEAVGWDEALARSVRELRVAETESAMGEATAHRMPVQLPNLAQRASYPLRDITLAAGFHSALVVPLVGAERILGAIILMRQEAGEFPAETVRLMQTLASQSVLAIQNARLFREIADKSEQLALASQHKSQFLANMSHELRTPLNAILGYAELLVDGIYGVLPDRPRGVLDRIQNNGKHLLALINDVLDLAKIEAGQLTLTLEDYSVPEVVKSVVTATEPLATSKGLKFTAALQDNLPMAHGDARRVSQVLLNLVGNAIKFTDKGEVEIRAMVDRGQFVLTVRDTGPGIADADQERIFGEFQQIDNSNTRKKGGTGLGLAISKRMVEMQGGTISVDSVLGQGSTFRVVLPVHVDEMMEAA